MNTGDRAAKEQAIKRATQLLADRFGIGIIIIADTTESGREYLRAVPIGCSKPIVASLLETSDTAEYREDAELFDQFVQDEEG